MAHPEAPPGSGEINQLEVGPHRNGVPGHGGDLETQRLHLPKQIVKHLQIQAHARLSAMLLPSPETSKVYLNRFICFCPRLYNLYISHLAQFPSSQRKENVKFRGISAIGTSIGLVYGYGSKFKHMLF